jgi:hypothetical protein
MPGRALDLYCATDTADPLTDRAQAHSMFYIDIKSASIVRHGKLHRVTIVHQRYIDAPRVTMPRYIGKGFLRNSIQCLLHVERQTTFVARD